MQGWQYPLMISLGAIAVGSLLGCLIAGFIARKLRLHKINRVLGRSSWGPLVPYAKVNEHKPGVFMTKDWK
jgi:MFS-type transporter involved in bile tolerance (Atg22 family)